MQQGRADVHSSGEQDRSLLSGLLVAAVLRMRSRGNSPLGVHEIRDSRLTPDIAKHMHHTGTTWQWRHGSMELMWTWSNC
jgi:hypothetical protein